MQDNISVLLATILAVIIIVLFPIYNIAMRNDSVANNIVIEATTNFVDEVRNNGYVSKKLYESYLAELDRTGNTYEVELEAYKPILIEEGILEGDSKVYDERYKIDYTDAILEKVYSNEIIANTESIINTNFYELDEGYKFYVRVKNTNITQAQVLMTWLLGGNTEERIVVNYGGIVYENNWERGEYATVANTNAFISKPMYLQDNQYKNYPYEAIADSIDEITGEINGKIYGIAVRLEDAIGNSSEIHFILTYKGISEFIGESDNILTTPEQRANHVKNHVEVSGITANEIVVNEIANSYKRDANNLYSVEYLITLKQITYDFENNAYMRSNLKIKPGSAQSRTGELAQINSEEFIVFYNTTKPVMEDLYISNPNRIINNNGQYTTSTGNVEFEFTAKAKTNSAISKIKKIKFEINNGKEVIPREVNASGTGQINMTTNISETFYIGDCYVKAWAVDDRGQESDKITFNFTINMPDVILNVPNNTWGYGTDMMNSVFNLNRTIPYNQRWYYHVTQQDKNNFPSGEAVHIPINNTPRYWYVDRRISMLEISLPLSVVSNAINPVLHYTLSSGSTVIRSGAIDYTHTMLGNYTGSMRVDPAPASPTEEFTWYDSANEIGGKKPIDIHLAIKPGKTYTYDYYIEDAARPGKQSAHITYTFKFKYAVDECSNKDLAYQYGVFKNETNAQVQTSGWYEGYNLDIPHILNAHIVDFWIKGTDVSSSTTPGINVENSRYPRHLDVYTPATNTLYGIYFNYNNYTDRKYTMAELRKNSSIGNNDIHSIGLFNRTIEAYYIKYEFYDM